MQLGMNFIAVLSWLKWGPGEINRPLASTRLVKVEARIQFANHKGTMA